ncbi:MAG: DUF1549 and DUF1553 domain-containing protein, partial [Actinomycetota bacterium]
GMVKVWGVSVAVALLAPAVGGFAAPRSPVTVRKPKVAVKAPSQPTVASIVLLPASIQLNGPAASQRLSVTAVFSDGSRQDVTARAALTTSAAKVAGLALTPAFAEVQARGDGKGSVTAVYQGKSARPPVAVVNVAQPASYSFRNDVVPVLARLGCSSGSCHGANSGKGGFRLSLRGYAPELDFLWITRQLGGRRISRENPEQSLLLRKPLMLVAHGGGKALEKHSREYYTLLGWLRQGAPGVDEKDPKLVSLTTVPGDQVFRRGQKQRVLIQAKYSDGSVRDVTSRAVFGSNDAGIASVSPDGEVVATAPGATAVQAKYADQLAVVRVTVPFPQKVNPAAFQQQQNFVDAAVYAKLRELNLEPSPRCSDEEFLRRVYVDAIGTLPTADEARRFLDSADPNKRDALIDEVLARPEYGSIWALKLCDLSMVRKEHMQRKYTVAINQWLTEQFQNNRPWDQIVKALVTASGPRSENPAVLWWASRQSTRPNSRGWVRHYELTGEIVAQVFLGQRIQCTKCHNHPTERYTQDDYYHFASIFAQVNGDRTLGDDPVPVTFLANDKGEVRHPRTGELMAPQPLDGSSLQAAEGVDRRLKFADWLTGAGREMFARNAANRVWARLFGSGIVEPVDDLRATNPPRNEALLAALARELISHGYDLKHLMKSIMRSRTYQTTSVSTPANRIDTQFFSHYPVRRLQGEELLDAIAQVTDVPDRYASYPIGTRAIELSDIELPSLALDTFGRPTRVTPCECDRTMAPSMSQALELFNGETLQGKLKHRDGAVAQLAKSGKSNEQVLEELFLRTLARRPTAKEQADLLRVLGTTEKREEVLQDVLWALINTKEFMFNH